jgi:hypothetical protein
MKFCYPLFLLLLSSQLVKAQVDDFPLERIPTFPGGNQNFARYVQKNLKYPEVARLIGINGKLKVQFVVDQDGKIVEVTPKNCIGAGCEAEAVKLLENSPKWIPGIQNGKKVRVGYSVPISFSIEPGKVKMSDLRQSAYGFVFNVKGSLYTIDEAEKLIGKSFQSERVEIAEPFYNYNKIEKLNMPGKKDIYLVIMKSS